MVSCKYLTNAGLGVALVNSIQGRGRKAGAGACPRRREGRGQCEPEMLMMQSLKGVGDQH